MNENSGQSQEQQLAQDLLNDPSGQNNESKGKIFSTTYHTCAIFIKKPALFIFFKPRRFPINYLP